MTQDVICVGTALVDIPLYPVSSETLNKVSFPLNDISMKIGGDAINEAIVLSKLGKKVALISAVGDDGAGNYIRKIAQKNKVNISSVKVNPNLTTSINIGLVKPDGQRTFLTNKNGSLWKMNENDIDFQAITDSKILSMASIFNNPLIDDQVILKIFQKAKKENMTICADIDAPRLGETIDNIKNILPYIDYFFPNDTEAKDLTNQPDLDSQSDLLLKLGVKNVVIKTGANGCFIKNKKMKKYLPSYEVPSNIDIDTTGAGDNFAAGFISKLAEGQSFENCARFGNAVASLSVRKLGAIDGVKNERQVEQLLKNYQKGDNNEFRR